MWPSFIGTACSRIWRDKARAALSWPIVTTISGRGLRGAAASTAFYMQALNLAPDNAAAHHYLIHS
jgi:hypothetical protein